MAKSQNFSGFTMPDASFFPPELRELLPYVDTVSELKVLLCVLDAYFQAGLDAQPLTMDQIERRTGLSRYGVNEGLKRGRTRGTLNRLSVGGIFAYEPSLKIRLPCHDHDHDHPHDSSEHEKEHDHACQSEVLRAKILAVLVQEFGVSSRVADDIAQHRDPGYVMRHIGYARYEVQTGFSPKNMAGYIVARIRDDRPPPLGFDKGRGAEEQGSRGAGENEKRWYSDEEFEQFFQH